MTFTRGALKWRILSGSLAVLFGWGLTGMIRPAGAIQSGPSLDEKVRAFLDSQRRSWHDENIREEDGKALFDLIVERGYTRALEVGTSTGRSGTWIAWALSKTGGRLTTIEIDEGRHGTAVANFKKAGLDGLINAQLGDAHEIVPRLAGPFDFIFVDADKEWYKRYLELLWPKVAPGGCFAAHNVLNLEFMRGIREFLDAAGRLPDAETQIDRSSSSGISLTFKKAGR
jgi:caffeoyl-CoA O-methyltransferase